MRFFDEFSEEWRSIRYLDNSNEWICLTNGQEHRLVFNTLNHASFVRLQKNWAAWAFKTLSPVTVARYGKALNALYDQHGYDWFENALLSEPVALRFLWHSQLISTCSPFHLSALKSLLYFCCESAMFHWSPLYIDYIGSFRLPVTDKFAAVRQGDVFLTPREEAKLVEYLDEINALVRKQPGSFTETQLVHACVLCTSYQYAMRPIQIAKVRVSDVRIHENENPDEPPIVHVTFLRAKQRSSGDRLPMTRKIKREWAYAFRALYDAWSKASARDVGKNALPDSLFGLTPNHVSTLIREITGDLLGEQRSANHLRHTAAQRLVDAGASQLELAEYMGHSYLDTGQVYFDRSPTQAAKVNKALALSPVYRTVAEVARTGTIDKIALLELPPDQQVAGVPHGIPIAGIGACQLGQSLCSKNPVMSCYDCKKFLAVRDSKIHKEVRDDLRGVARCFFDESRGDNNSPTYMQLRRTLEAVEATLNEIEEVENIDSPNRGRDRLGEDGI